MALAIPELYLKLNYKQKDLTSALAPFVTSIEVSDSLDKKDSLAITLEDSLDKWKEAWYPVKTDTLSLEFGYQGGSILKIGKFAIDEIRFSAPPDTVQIQALAVDLSKPLETKKTRTFKNLSLKQIVQQVAAEAGLQVLGEIDNIQLLCRRQNNSSDLGFLKQLALDYGYYLALKEDRLIFTKREKLKKDESRLQVDKSDCISCSFSDQTHQVYKACNVVYWDPRQKKTLKYTHQVEGLKTGDILIIKSRVENEEQAKAKAQAALTEKNERQVQGQLSLPGATVYTAGTQIELTGLGVLSGVYTIMSARHQFSSSGWTVGLEVQRNKLKPDDTQAAKKKKKRGAKDKFDGQYSYITDDRGVSRPIRPELVTPWETFKSLCQQRFTGIPLWITATTDGAHAPGSDHYNGKAIDCALDCDLSAADSMVLASLAQQAGFKVLNEYVYKSANWTGGHLHLYL